MLRQGVPALSFHCYFQFVDAYPLTASGKVQKFILRENAIKVLGLEEVVRMKTA